jgi:hypothetical protein
MYLKHEVQSGRTNEVLRNGDEIECFAFKGRYTE